MTSVDQPARQHPRRPRQRVREVLDPEAVEDRDARRRAPGPASFGQRGRARSGRRRRPTPRISDAAEQQPLEVPAIPDRPSVRKATATASPTKKPSATARPPSSGMFGPLVDLAVARAVDHRERAREARHQRRRRRRRRRRPRAANRDEPSARRAPFRTCAARSRTPSASRLSTVAVVAVRLDDRAPFSTRPRTRRRSRISRAVVHVALAASRRPAPPGPRRPRARSRSSRRAAPSAAGVSRITRS